MGYGAGEGRMPTWVPWRLIRDGIGSYPQGTGNEGERNHGETVRDPCCVSPTLVILNHSHFYVPWWLGVEFAAVKGVGREKTTEPYMP